MRTAFLCLRGRWLYFINKSYRCVATQWNSFVVRNQTFIVRFFFLMCNLTLSLRTSAHADILLRWAFWKKNNALHIDSSSTLHIHHCHESHPFTLYTYIPVTMHVPSLCAYISHHVPLRVHQSPCTPLHFTPTSLPPCTYHVHTSLSSCISLHFTRTFVTTHATSLYTYITAIMHATSLHTFITVTIHAHSLYTYIVVIMYVPSLHTSLLPCISLYTYITSNYARPFILHMHHDHYMYARSSTLHTHHCHHACLFIRTAPIIMHIPSF